MEEKRSRSQNNMKTLLVTILVGVLLLGSGLTAEARVSVKGSVRKNGTYVAPHYRSSPNSSRYDNWSTQGNYNPYTGRKGYNNPYKSKW